MVEKSDVVYVLAGKEKFQEKGFHTYTDWENVFKESSGDGIR